MIHLGDITKINGAEIEPVDCITAGSPCQDLSVAGKRAGLEGERSGLFMEQIRIIKEMREHDRNNGRTDEFIRPRYMVWENVPGAFSSNKGEDFRCVLEETAKVAERDAVIPGPPKGKWSKSGAIMGDGWSIAWRVHDAQFWGVPQRRKRIALVADFGGESAPEILFERKSLSGDIAKSGKERQRAAKDAEGCVGETDATFKVIGFNRERCGAVAMDDMMPTLQAAAGESGNNQPMAALSFQERAGKPGGGKGILIQNERTGALSTLNNQSVCAFEPGAASRVGGHVYEDDKAGTVRANAGDNRQAVVYGISAYDSNAMKSNNPNSGIYEAETSRTLDLNGGSPACNQGGMAVVQKSAGFCPEESAKTRGIGYEEENAPSLRSGVVPGVVCLNDQGGSQIDVSEEVSGTLRAQEHGHQPIVLEGNGARPSHQGDGYTESETMYTMNATERHAVCVENHPNDSRVKISEDGIVQTLSSRMGTGGGNVPMVMEPYTSSKASYHQRFTNDGKAETLVASDYKDPPTITYGLDRASFNQGENAKFDFSIDEEKTGPQVARGPGAVFNSIVRRLTPLECERLQGFPDYWTDIGDWVDSKGKKHKGDADSPRYKALGNSIALPFWFYLLRRISAQYERPATLGSLFDGIGGFPLCWERCNGKGTARWASEIEEFPIAVTKHWFG